MARFKNTEFAEGLDCSFTTFKKRFKNVIQEGDLEEAYKVATGNVVRKVKKSAEPKPGESSD